MVRLSATHELAEHAIALLELQIDHALELLDAEIGDEGAARGEDMAQVGRPGCGLVDGFGPPDAAAEAHEDDIRSTVEGLREGRTGGQTGGKPQRSEGEAATVHARPPEHLLMRLTLHESRSLASDSFGRAQGGRQALLLR